MWSPRARCDARDSYGSHRQACDQGFVQRTRCEADRRQVLVSLTKEGRKAYRAHELFHRQMVDAALDGLTPEEEAAFARGSRR